MTDEQLAEIEARANAATPGPWSPFPSGILHQAEWVVSNVPRGERGRIMRDEDSAFIAAARTDVLALVAEVKRLREEIRSAMVGVKGLREEIRHLREKIAYARAAEQLAIMEMMLKVLR